VDLIPAKKKKKQSPMFTSNIFLIRYRNEVLLEKRPPKAIWGGLYSLIETPWQPVAQIMEESKQIDFADIINQTDLAKYLSKKDMGEITSIEASSPIEHVFSHRRLRMQPWVIHLKRKWPCPNETINWICTSRLNEYGLPQPIRVFLESNSR